MQNQFYPGSQSSNNNHANLGPPPSQSFSYNQLNGPSNGANQMQGETLPLPVPTRNRSAESSPNSSGTHAQWGPPPSQSFSYNQLNGPSNGANQMQGETLLLPVPARNRSAR